MNGLYGRTGRPRLVGWALPVALLLGAAVLAGCSSGGPGGSGGSGGSAGSGGTGASTGAAGSQREAVAVLRELVRCARANGMPNLPDPQIDANGQPVWPGGEPPEPTERVQRACRSIIERLPAQPPGEGADPASVPTLVRFAECIRSHGFPAFPDPRPDGKFDASAFPPGVKPGNPEFDAAMQACRSLNPDPNGEINVH
jgi:hypothetical protein